MSKTKLRELVTLLTKNQQQSLFEQVVQSRDEQVVSGEIQRPKQYDIAIIGLSGRYPQADDHYDFWKGLQEGRNFIEEVPATLWDHSQYYDQHPNKPFVPHKTSCKFGAFLKAHDKFDASFFNLRPEEVYYMDPQERLALETTWACIEDAGYVPANLGENVGIFSGVTYSEYQKLLPISTHSYMLNNRIAYFFNFQGPAVTTDAGCSSSLTAIHLACQSLKEKECQTALVVGTNLILHPDHYTSVSSMLSRTTKPYSNPFGTDDGWIPAEGVISILLKPLQQSLQDQNHIYAVIKSSHICQEGKTCWFAAFNPKQQAKLIQDNFKKSGIHPETISYVEAAANGSSFGDAIEMEGLTTAFGQFTNKKQFCPIGTVKSNVGHGEGVSTLFQLTKVLLQFKSKTLIPLINVKETNPNIKIESTPFYFQTTTQKWEPPTINLNEKQFEIPRRATISSFGSGGTIGHLILEEHVDEVREIQNLKSYFIPLSSKTAEQLRQLVENYINFFEQYRTMDCQWESHYSLLNIMFTLCVGRVPFEERVVFIDDNLETLISKFHLFVRQESDPSIIYKAQAGKTDAILDKNRAQIQNYLVNHSWNELAELWVHGAPIYWETFFHSYNVQRIPLPTYCFQKQCYPITQPGHPEIINKDVRITSAAEIEVSDKNRNNDEFCVSSAMTSLKSEVKGPSHHNNNLDRIVRNFEELFAAALNIPKNQIDSSMPLAEYGFNSEMVVFVANKLEKCFSVVPKTLFFECQTIQDVVDYFIKNNPDKIQMMIQHRGNEVNPEQVTIKSNKQRMDQPKNHDVFQDNSEQSQIKDSIADLTKAILSENISAEEVLKKI